MSSAFRIRDLRVFTIAPGAKAGTYFKPGDSRHWLVDTLISNPMSGHPEYREKRSSWGIGVLGALVVEIETEDGPVGVATGSGGVPAAWLIRPHVAPVVVGDGARSSLPYGR